MKHDWVESKDNKRPPFIQCRWCGHLWLPGQPVPKHPCDDRPKKAKNGS